MPDNPAPDVLLTLRDRGNHPIPQPLRMRTLLKAAARLGFVCRRLEHAPDPAPPVPCFADQEEEP